MSALQNEHLDFDLVKASRRLSELELTFNIDNLRIDVIWFRAMEKSGEWVINRHNHSSYEFHFISSGNCRVRLDDREFTVSSGEFYITPPGVNHEQSNLDTDLMVEYCLNCDFIPLGEESGNRRTEMGQVFTVLAEAECAPIPDSEGVLEFFETALREACHQTLGFYNKIRWLIPLIIIATARMLPIKTAVSYEIPVREEKNDFRYTQILKYIEDNISNPISTLDIARHMALSEKQVCRIVKERLAVSTKDLIIRLKLQKAKELLRHPELSIKEIAYRLGFSSEYYFSQCFKHNEGIPPGVYRLRPF